MTQEREQGLTGVLLSYETTFTVQEVCRVCGVERTTVQELVAEGILEPEAQAEDWRFHGESVVRAQRAVRLVRDLGLNFAGAALALDLLDEIRELRGYARGSSVRVRR